jgi:ubiquitin-protein ligase E3 C
MFSPRELQILISGTPNPIDLEDLKKHTNYSGGYSDTHPAIKCFWKVVAEFSETEKRQLLKFVTSCSRPPLLGFKNLHPPFCIHFAGKEDRLPSSSTCMNLLKLPEYIEKETLKSKLLYAITSGVGFELS